MTSGISECTPEEILTENDLAVGIPKRSFFLFFQIFHFRHHCSNRISFSPQDAFREDIVGMENRGLFWLQPEHALV